MSKNRKHDVNIEWDKIKEANIFESFSDFKKLYDSNPNGWCFKKWTNYPWSKKNFFFGEYKDLLEWYKNNSEIPEYLENYIGKKFYSLTIKGFEFKEVNSKNVLFANCICDCGEKVQKEWKRIIDGNARTCGCKQGKGKKEKKQSIGLLFPKIVKKYWDFDKNNADPNYIDIYSKDEYWWKGYDESFRMAPFALIGKGKGTSFQEQAFLFYLKRYYPDCEGRKKIIHDGNKYEVDIFVPSINIAIEYDGVVWHKDKFEKENAKNDAINSEGIFLIRVRESGLQSTIIKKGAVVGCDIENKGDFDSLVEAINNVFAVIYNKTLNKNILDFHLTKKELILDKPKIQSQYLISFESENIQCSWLSKYWSQTNEIEKYKVSLNSLEVYDFLCANGYPIRISPRAITNIYNKSFQEKEVLLNDKFLFNDGRCPFASSPICPCNRIYHVEDYKMYCEFFSKAQGTSLATISFDETVSKFNHICNNFKESKVLWIFQKRFQDIFIDICKYKTIKKYEIINSFINDMDIDNELKFSLLYNTLHWPYFSRKEISDIFNDKVLLNFYLKMNNYNEIILKNEEYNLNLFHEHNIFDIIKAFIYRKNFSNLEHLIFEIKECSGNLISEYILYSVLVQSLIKGNKKTYGLFGDKNAFLFVVDMFKKNFSKKYISKTDSLLSCVRECDEKKLNFQEYFLGTLIRNKIYDKTLQSQELLSIKEKFDDKKTFDKLLFNIVIEQLNKNSYEFLFKVIYDMVFQKKVSRYLDYDINITSAHFQIVNKGLSDNYFPDFSMCDDLYLIERFINLKLSVKLNLDILFTHSKYDLIKKYFKINKGIGLYFLVPNYSDFLKKLSDSKKRSDMSLLNFLKKMFPHYF